MNSRLIFFLLILLSAGRPASAQSEFTVSGIVLDSLTVLPLSNVAVMVEGMNRSTVTDESGRFSIPNIPKGTLTLHFSRISHETGRLQLQLKENLTALRISLVPAAYNLKDFFITADRQQRNADDIPASVYTITGSRAEVYAMNNTDELLYLVPGIHVDRDRGVFSKNSSISMRGLNGSARTLVLLDGVPVNKADGAGINWARIDPDMIDRIEVMKGPNSTIYGSNAMGGVINIITAKDTGPFRARVKTFYGTYNTAGGSISASGSRIRNQKGIYWSLNSLYRKGDGYIPVADSLRDSLDAKTYLEEAEAGVRVGYQFSESGSLEAEYNYYWDKRGDGTFIYEPGGSYNQYPTHFTRLKYQSKFGNWQLTVNGFYQLEHYLRQNETIKKQNGKYTLYETDSRRIDAGLWLSAALSLPSNRRLTTGIDLKKGSVDASDLYLTSTDVLRDQGKMDLGAVFAQFETPFISSKLSLEVGIRLDVAKFHGGSFTIADPSSLSEFMTNYPTQFHDTSWIAASPRITLLFHPRKQLKTYLSYSRGFRPPTLDDMCRNGNVTKGFKLANPALGPEHLNNFEVGYTAKLFEKLSISQSLFYSLGRDFQYFVASGDSVYTGGDNQKPVLQRQNISKVNVYGTEFSINLELSRSLICFGNYAYSHSVLHPDESKAPSTATLKGKMLMEVPANQASVGVEWRYKWFMAGADYQYTGKLFADDDNLVVNPARYEAGIRLSANYLEKAYLSLSIQDVFNHRYADTKGNISPGRFLMCSLILKIRQ